MIAFHPEWLVPDCRKPTHFVLVYLSLQPHWWENPRSRARRKGTCFRRPWYGERAHMEYKMDSILWNIPQLRWWPAQECYNLSKISQPSAASSNCIVEPLTSLKEWMRTQSPFWIPDARRPAMSWRTSFRAWLQDIDLVGFWTSMYIYQGQFGGRIMIMLRYWLLLTGLSWSYGGWSKM